MANSKTKVVTGLVRLSYANVWEPKAANENAQPKYSVSIIIPKSDKETLKKINDAIDAAIEEGIGKFGGKKPNPKYAMRTWLLRLGFIGDEFATAREILTRNLRGDAAFRSGTRAC